MSVRPLPIPCHELASCGSHSTYASAGTNNYELVSLLVIGYLYDQCSKAQSDQFRLLCPTRIFH